MRERQIAAASFGFFLLLTVIHPSALAAIRYEKILELSKQFEPKSAEYSDQQGAKIIPVRDGRSFVLWWQPADFNPKQSTVFVSLHGHGGWAAKDFYVWQPHLKNRGYAFLGIQWWYGRSMDPVGYAKPRDIYAWIAEVLQEKNIPPGHVIFTGFSMGAANSYAITYLDRRQPQPYFAITISNAGAMEEDFPPNRGFLDLRDGPSPFAGAHWVLYCAEHDEQRPQSCEDMERTKTALETRGAVVEKFIRDPSGGHGGFMKEESFAPVLDLADQIVAKAKPASR